VSSRFVLSHRYRLAGVAFIMPPVVEGHSRFAQAAELLFASHRLVSSLGFQQSAAKVYL